MKQIKNQSKLRRTADKITKPLGRAAYLTQRYAVEPVITPIAKLDARTDKLTEKALQTASGKVEHEFQQTDTGQAAVVAAKVTTAIIKDHHQYRKSMREYEDSKKPAVNLNKYSRDSQSKRKAAETTIKTQTASLNTMIRNYNAEKAKYRAAQQKLKAQYNSGSINKSQYQAAAQRLNTKYAATGFVIITFNDDTTLEVVARYDRYTQARSVAEIAQTLTFDENHGLTAAQLQVVNTFAAAYVED